MGSNEDALQNAEFRAIETIT